MKRLIFIPGISGKRTTQALSLLFAVCLIVGTIHAQDAVLEAYTPVTGAINAADDVETWTFTGSEGAVVTLYAVGDGLDPELAISNSSGQILAQNDDIAYPGTTDAMLQAVTLPRTDTYTVTVSGYADTTGGYTLTMFNGYPETALNETFDEVGEVWQAANADVVVDNAGGLLTLSTSGQNVYGLVLNRSMDDLTDFYADVEVENVLGRSGWNMGLVLRQSASGYYLLAFNHLGQWRLTLVASESSEEQIIRDWTTHPAIVPNQEQFRIGVLANAGAFDVFYNTAYVGQAVDASRSLTSGKLGLYTGTPNITDASAQVGFTQMTVTTPRLIGDEEFLPTQLVPGGQALTVQELERRRVIPSGGELAFNVPESFGQRINPGVNRVLLGRGVTVGDLVLGTTLTWQTAADGVVGCGLVFGNVSETEYSLAYIDQTGGYGLSPRVGDEFLPGLFGTNPAWTEGSQQLLVVRQGDTATLYVNRQYVGTTIVPDDEGEIGVAVVNYETIDTTCQFADTWVWRLR